MKPDPIAYLKSMEWSAGWERCPECMSSKTKGHKPRCRRAACLALPQSEEPAGPEERSAMPRELSHVETVGQLSGWLHSLPPETKLFSWFPETNEMSPCMSGLYDPEKCTVELTASYDGDDEEEPAQTRRVRGSVAEAAVAYLAAKDTEPEKDCWDTETGEEEPGAAKFPSDWAWNDYHDKVNAALDKLRAALSATPEQGRVEERNPDYVYDKNAWEWTSNWEDRDTLTDGMCVGEIIHVGTLYSGPDKWAARIDETEVRWFDTKEEAEAALAPRATTDHDGETDV